MLKKTILIMWVSLGCSLWCTGLWATQRYESGITESQWQVSASPLQCELRHDISRYGDGRFVFSAGGELAFQLHSIMEAPQDSVASLVSVAPFWRKNKEKELAQLTLNKGSMPFYVGGALALRIMYELEAGHQPTFHYKDWADYEDDVYVTVSSVNFHESMMDFQRCMANALPQGSEVVTDAMVYFDNNQYHLSQEQRKQLGQLVLYASLDKKIKIELSGHADGVGKPGKNLKLSSKRARSVKHYLLSKGVSEQQISVSALGESQPRDTNRTESGRSNNRRVLVAIKR